MTAPVSRPNDGQVNKDVDEQLIFSYGHDKEGKEYPLSYTAVGWGPGWPRDYKGRVG